MTALAYYNEYEPYAAQWLRNLISKGHIAPGDVDERSIWDVKPDDLKPYRQCHFFAGVGVWSYALRRIGWPDHRRIWTGSCPCQPFSGAGKRLGFADERHLWPAFFHLITHERPELIVGEQVAKKDGFAWLDLVQTDLENANYALGAIDTSVAGFGAPHIRQRLYWMAHANERNPEQFEGEWARSATTDGTGAPGWITGRGDFMRLDDASRKGLEGQCDGSETPVGWNGAVRPVAAASEFSGLAHTNHAERGPEITRRNDRYGENPERQENTGYFEGRGAVHGVAITDSNGRPTGPTNGLWRDVDWLFCRDGKWRPVEPATFPLAHGVTNRVGKLRAYGNALTVAQAEEFLKAALS